MERLQRSLPPVPPPPLVPGELPKGVPILGRGKGMLVKYIDDDEHLKDFAEYME